MLPWTCLVWNLISHIPPIPSLEVSHAINIRPISMQFTRSTLNDPKYTHTKNHINRKRLPYEFWYWTKTAITFGEECSRSIHAFYRPSVAGINLPHQGEVDSYNLCRMIHIIALLYFLSSSALSHQPCWNKFYKLFFALLAHCERNQLVTDGLRSQRVSNVELWRVFFYNFAVATLNRLLNKPLSC